MIEHFLVEFKPFILIVAAIPTGLFVRTVGEWFVSWAKQPKEKAKEQKQKKAICAALGNTIGNAHQYCNQMSEYLTGIPFGDEPIDDKLKDAAVQVGKMVVVPTFNRI